MGSSITSVQDIIGSDKGLDPDAAGELTVWEGMQFIQRNLTKKLGKLDDKFTQTAECEERLHFAVQTLSDRVDRLLRRMDYGLVGMRDGMGMIPNLIPQDEDETPGSFFKQVWDIITYALTVIKEESKKQENGQDTTVESCEVL